jgi:cell division protein FtsI (penicillin-binding protein 3)
MTTDLRSRHGAFPANMRRPAAVPAAAPRAHRAPRRRRTRVSPRRRILGVFFTIAIAFVLLAARLVDVQVRDRAYYARLGFDQRVRVVTLAAGRGSIFDRNGNDLALSVARSSVWADPRQVKDPAADAAKLAPIVGVDAAQLRQHLAQKNRAFVYVARQVENNVAARVRALGLVGVGFVPESKRYYTAQPLAAPLLGFVGTDTNGLAGLESGFETTLAGKPGRMRVEQDARGRRLPDGQQTLQSAERGSDLVLTIDESLQYEAERVLVEEVDAARAKGGMVAIADVRTGDILAMASVDGTTAGVPAHPAYASEHNRPLTDVFEPGSTNKVVTIAAALESGIVSPGTVLQVPSHIVVDNKDYADVATHPTSMSVADIVRESSNVGTILIAHKLGAERFDKALRAFGFGTSTGLGYPGEAAGILLPLSQYNSTSLASMPIGNGIAVTAMQMLDVYLTIANNGVARAPRLIAAMVDADGQRHELPLGGTRRVVSPTTARSMQSMLAAVVAGGTGTKAQIPGYEVAGKTGTARKPPYDKPPYKYVASFAGFAPASAPRLAAIVVLDEPHSSYTGGQVAAPVFARIMQYALAVERVTRLRSEMRPDDERTSATVPRSSRKS